MTATAGRNGSVRRSVLGRRPEPPPADRAVVVPRTVTVLLCLTWFTAPMSAQSFAGYKVVDLLLVVSAVCVVLYTSRPARPRERKGLYLPRAARRLAVGVTLMVAGLCLGQLRSDLGDSTILIVVQYGILAMLPTIILLRVRASPRLIAPLMASLVAGSIVSALYGITGTIESSQGRAIGLAAHMNQLGIISAITLPIIWAIPRRRFVSWLFALVASGLMLAALNDSGSRSAMIGLLAIVITSLLYVLRRAFGVLVAVVVVAIVAVGVVRILPSGDSDASTGVRVDGNSSAVSRVGGESVGRSDDYRSALLEEGLDALTPSGVLAGNGYELDKAPHNVYLETLVVGGLIAVAGLVIVFLPWVLLALRGALVAWRRPPPADLQLLASGVVGFVVWAAFNNAIWVRFIWCVLALAVAISVNREHGKRSAEDDPIEVGELDDPAVIDL